MAKYNREFILGKLSLKNTMIFGREGFPNPIPLFQPYSPTEAAKNWPNIFGGIGTKLKKGEVLKENVQ